MVNCHRQLEMELLMVEPFIAKIPINLYGLIVMDLVIFVSRIRMMLLQIHTTMAVFVYQTTPENAVTNNLGIYAWKRTA